MKQTAKQKLEQTRKENPKPKSETVTAKRKIAMSSARTKKVKGYGELDDYM